MDENDVVLLFLSILLLSLLSSPFPFVYLLIAIQRKTDGASEEDKNMLGSTRVDDYVTNDLLEADESKMVATSTACLLSGRISRRQIGRRDYSQKILIFSEFNVDLSRTTDVEHIFKPPANLYFNSLQGPEVCAVAESRLLNLPQKVENHQDEALIRGLTPVAFGNVPVHRFTWSRRGSWNSEIRLIKVTSGGINLLKDLTTNSEEVYLPESEAGVGDDGKEEGNDHGHSTRQLEHTE